MAKEASKSLGRSATRGAATTFGGQIVRITVQLAGVVILARFLGPGDYGVIAMVLAVVGVGEVFRDFGLSTAVIQAREVTSAQRTNLFWLNTVIGVVFALAVCGLSWPISMIYGDPQLQPVAMALSVTFLLNAMNTQYRSHLNREMRLVRLTSAEVIGQVGGLGIGIALAASGFGYWALVAQQISQLAIQHVVLLFITGWLPGLPKRGVPIAGFLRFGRDISGVKLLDYASRNVDSVVIGTTSGAVMLGLYNRAFQLMLLPLHQVNAPSTRVALPVLARLQDQRERFASFLAVGQTAMLNLVCGIVALCAAQAGPLIAISLGPQWSGAVPIFQILAIAGVFQVVGFTSHWVFMAKGLTIEYLKYSLISRPIMILMLIAGGIWGVYGVAAAYSAASALMWPMALWWLSRVSDAPVRMIFLTGARTIVIFAGAAAASVVATQWLPSDASWLRLCLGVLAMIAALGLAVLIVPPYRADVRRVLAIREYFKKDPKGSGDDPDSAEDGQGSDSGGQGSAAGDSGSSDDSDAEPADGRR